MGANWGELSGTMVSARPARPRVAAGPVDADQAAGYGTEYDLRAVAHTLYPGIHLALAAPLERVAINLLAAAERKHLAVRDEVVLLLHALHVGEGDKHHEQSDCREHGGGGRYGCPSPIRIGRQPTR